MSIRIRIEHGEGAGTTWRLGAAGVYVMGRDIASSMRVLDMKVSKAHAEVHLVENNGQAGAVFRDLGSTHGSLLNGQPVKSDKPLRPGDELRVGLTILRVLSDGEADHTLKPVSERDVDAASVSAATSSSGMIDTSSARKLPPDALVGKDLGGYKVQQKIGQGGMGSVYLAEQLSLHRQVALKVLSDKFVKDEVFVEQFLNEARAAGQLNHPNVVQVYDVGEAAGHYYFSMEFVAGGSIEERLKDGDGYTWQDGLNWFLDATNALVFAKRREILHRDVKPDNLMISEDGSAKLCDLGLAKRSENEDLMDQGIIGTPHFISPEAIRRKTAVDHRTDLYSLGCTFFRILAGKNPYPGKTVKEILLGHLKKPVPRVTQHNRDVPKELDDIVYKLMQKEPDDRFQLPTEVLQALDKIRVRHGLEAHGIAPKGGKRWIALAAVALLAGVGAVIFAMNQDPGVAPDKVLTATERAGIRAGKIHAQNKPFEQAESTARQELQALVKLRTDLLFKHGKKDLWTNAEYKSLPAKYTAYVTTWQAVVDDFKADRDKQEFDEVKQRIDTAIAETGKMIVTATAHGKEISDYVERREASAEEWKSMTDQGLADFKAALKQKRTHCDTLLADGETDFTKWVDLALEFQPDSLKDLLQPIFDKAQIEGESIFDWDQDVQPLITKSFPDSALKRYVEAPPTEVSLKSVTAIKAARDLRHHKGTVTPEALDAAIAALDTWIESLPAAPDPAAGEISKRLLAVRKVAVEASEKYADERDEMRSLRLLADRLRYHALILAVRAPLAYGGGSWFRFDHQGASVRITSWVSQLETAAYQKLGAIWERDTVALARLFTRLKSRWDDGKWDGDRSITYVDDDGVEQSCRCQGVEIDSFEHRKEVVRFEAFGPKRLIDSIFLVKQKDGTFKARFTFDTEDLRGLALLAEMAGDFDHAQAWWIAYKATIEAGTDASGDVDHHLKMLPLERTAGGLWLRAQVLRGRLAAVIERYTGDKRITKDEWRVYVSEVRGLNSMLGAATTRMDELRDAKLAPSVWASSLLRQAHRHAAYSGNKIPDRTYERIIKQARRALRR